MSQYKIHTRMNQYKRGKAQTVNQVNEVQLTDLTLTVALTRADPRAERGHRTML